MLSGWNEDLDEHNDYVAMARLPHDTCELLTGFMSASPLILTISRNQLNEHSAPGNTAVAFLPFHDARDGQDWKAGPGWACGCPHRRAEAALLTSVPDKGQ